MAGPTMSNIAKYESLVIAVASGVSVSAWCRTHKTARSTVAKWQSKPEFASDVQACRRRMLDRVVGKFKRAVNRAADGMIKLAASASSEATKLAAQRAVLENLVQIREFAELNQRLDDLEAKVKANEEVDG